MTYQTLFLVWYAAAAYRVTWRTCVPTDSVLRSTAVSHISTHLHLHTQHHPIIRSVVWCASSPVFWFLPHALTTHPSSHNTHIAREKQGRRTAEAAAFRLIKVGVCHDPSLCSFHETDLSLLSRECVSAPTGSGVDYARKAAAAGSRSSAVYVVYNGEIVPPAVSRRSASHRIRSSVPALAEVEKKNMTPRTERAGLVAVALQLRVLRVLKPYFRIIFISSELPRRFIPSGRCLVLMHYWRLLPQETSGMRGWDRLQAVHLLLFRAVALPPQFVASSHTAENKVQRRIKFV